MKKRFFIISYSFLALSIFLFPKSAFAEESIKNFNVSLTAHKNGTMSVDEKIQYDFYSNAKHGIYRFIPLVTQVGTLDRAVDVHFSTVLMDGQNEPYSVSSASDKTQVKIGSPDKTITGVHTYTIQYDVDNGIGSNYADHDEIYWNVTGNEWTVPISQASILMKTDFGVSPGNTICYTGITGATNKNCTITAVLEGKEVMTTAALSPSEGLTVVASFPLNTFPKSTLQNDQPTVTPDFLSFIKIISIIYSILNFIIAPGIFYWYLKHKRKNRFGQVTVNFDIPEYPKGHRIIPAEAGTIDNAKLERNDVIATIFDLAIRKYLKIEQIEKKIFLGLGSHNNYKFIKLKNFSDLNDFERCVMNAVFGERKEVLMTDVHLDYIVFPEFEYKNFQSLIHQGFYIKNPTTQMKALFTLGVFLTVTLNIILGPLLIFLSRKLNGRTALGDTIDWQIDGLKLFLKNMSPEYKWQAEKAYVVEAMIPYAMALGYIDEYMKQIKISHPDYQPTWYVGRGSFYTIYPHFNQSFSNNITTTAPSSSSGFSGGFSGGGGGGGGGGSW